MADKAFFEQRPRRSTPRRRKRHRGEHVPTISVGEHTDLGGALLPGRTLAACRLHGVRVARARRRYGSDDELETLCAHGGVPDIDPDKHRLVIHGLVRQPLVFTLDALARYPMASRIVI